MTTTSVPPTSLPETTSQVDPWRGFEPGEWTRKVDVRDFIQRNYTPYEGDASFLAGPTPRTEKVWAKLSSMFPDERERGVYDVDASTPSTITSHAPGYIDRDLEIIVGLQTDAPLRRAIMPDRKSTRLNSSHVRISYAVFCLKKKKKKIHLHHTL